MPRRDMQKSSQSRVFTIEDRAGPANAPVYQSLARALGVSWTQGDVTPIGVPDANQYGQFVVVDRIKGQRGLPAMSLQFRMTRALSDMLKLVRKGCPLDVQVHIGQCKTPTDFNGGWDKIVVLEGAEATDYTTDDLGALDADQDAAVNETIPFSGIDYYEIKPLAGSEIGSSEIVQEIVAVALCDSRTCGECGLPSDGCQVVFALTQSAGGSPGLPAELIYTEDQGATLGETNISTLAANEDPSDMACVGTNLVVISNASDSLHYAAIADVLDGTETWSEVTTGIVAAGSPNAIFSLGQTFTWIVGDGGYVYFSSDITAGVDVQDAGVTTTEVLNDIHGVDELNLVAVGANNAVIVTSNGGSTWTAITGPNPGVVLNTVWMRSTTEWFIGCADGTLWYTRDSGASWTQKRFSGDGAGQVRKIVFATPTVGYMSHDTATPTGRIFRSIDGGHSWYALPEAAGLSLPAADRFNDLAACGDDPNLVFGGGLADDGSDGIFVKAA